MIDEYIDAQDESAKPYLNEIRLKKTVFIITTVFIMLITSRFVIRIVDATVQIDNDIALLVPEYTPF